MRGRYITGGVAAGMLALIATSERVSNEFRASERSTASSAAENVAASPSEHARQSERRVAELGAERHPPSGEAIKYATIAGQSERSWGSAPTGATVNSMSGESAKEAVGADNDKRPKITIREMYDRVCQTEYGNPYCDVVLPLVEKATDQELTAPRDEWAMSMKNVLEEWASQYVQNGVLPGVDVGCTSEICAIHLHGSFEVVSKSGALSDEGFTKDLRNQQWYSKFRKVFESRTPKEQTPFWPASRNGIGMRMQAPLRFTCAIGDGPCGAIIILERN